MTIPDKIDQQQFDELLKYISVEKQKRVKQHKRPQNALQIITADILIRSIVHKKFKIKNSNIDFKTNEYGKPYLPGFSEFHFNISHSRKWVVCAVDNMPIGIDIEFIRPINFDIARKFFSRTEYNDLFSKSDSERLEYFYELWTLKESYIKAAGKGMAIPLNSFSIQIINGKITIESQTQLTDYYFRKYDIDVDYKLSVCAKNNQFPDNIIHKSFDQLFEEINK